MTTSIYTNNYRNNITLYWQQFYPNWSIPEGYHVHHIKPKSTFSDPTDPKINHPKNLIALHPDDHQSIHKCRGDKALANGFLSIKNRKLSNKTKKILSKLRKGKLLSEEHKNKIALGLKLSRKNNPEKFIRIVSLDTKRKIAIGRLGKKATQKTKDKMSKSQKERFKDPKERLKVSSLGHHNGMFNKRHSIESKDKMSKSSKGKNTGNKNHRFKGYYITPFGKYASSIDIVKIINIDNGTVIKYCKSNFIIVTKLAYVRSKYLQELGKLENIVGKSFKELGFGFVPIER